MNFSTRIAAVTGVFALALTLAACGAQDPTPEAAVAASASSAATTDSRSVDGAHNDADVSFAQMMIVHHEGAVVMANLAVRNASTEDVKSLGKRIGAAQDPEIGEMNAWLAAWGEKGPADITMEEMDMGGADQESAMNELDSASGDDFDRHFLKLMIEHHRGALDMAEAELTNGKNPKALELAQTIIDTQKAEIAQMEKLLRNF